MKGSILGIIVMALIVGFGSISPVEARNTGITEKGIAKIVKEAIKADGSPEEVIHYSDFSFVEKNKATTESGTLRFYVITATIDVEGGAQYKYIYRVYAGERGKNKFCSAEGYSADASNPRNMIKYEELVSEYIQWAKDKEGVEKGEIALAML